MPAVATAASHNASVALIASQLLAGGFAGAAARTVVAPLDRIKILMQTQFITQRRADKYNGTIQSLRLLMSEEGSVAALWKGNAVNVLRVIPYSAAQFASYDAFKRLYRNNERSLNTAERLVAGAFAAVSATTITHPLDVIRLRLSVQPELKTFRDALSSVWSEGKTRALFKGFVPTIISVTPFIAINFAAFDAMKQSLPERLQQSTATALLMGAASGLIAQSICYPLDTIRRRQQLSGFSYASISTALTTIIKQEGINGLYKGMVPNAVKVVPNNAIRFAVYEWIRQYMGLQKGKSAGAGI